MCRNFGKDKSPFSKGGNAFNSLLRKRRVREDFPIPLEN
jgi:hypothetical protein